MKNKKAVKNISGKQLEYLLSAADFIPNEIMRNMTKVKILSRLTSLGFKISTE